MHSPGSASLSVVATLGFFKLFEHAMFLQLQLPYYFLESSSHETYLHWLCLPHPVSPSFIYHFFGELSQIS